MPRYGRNAIRCARSGWRPDSTSKPRSAATNSCHCNLPPNSLISKVHQRGSSEDEPMLFQRRLTTLPVVLTIAALSITIGNAQDYRAKVQGIITDSTQAVVVGAQVTLRRLETGVATARQSNETGRYLFDYVERGTYTLTRSEE